MTYKCEPDFISITAGTFDEESIRGQLPRVKQHIFLDEKVKTCAFQKRMDAWKKVLTSPGLG